jgi:Tfp pilus assembly protein PilO
MKTGKFGSLLPTQTLVLCIICAAGLLAFVLFIIWPAQRLSDELDREIAGLKARIEEQKILVPFFKTLFEKAKPSPAKGLTAAPRTRLSRGEIAGVPKRLQEMAAAHRLNARDIVPDVNTLTDAANRFMVNFTASGRFEDLRGFLFDVAALSFFESMDEIEVRAVEGGKEFGLKIWLARE